MRLEAIGFAQAIGVRWPKVKTANNSEQIMH